MVGGAAWLGEVIVVGFVLVPLLARLDHERQNWFLATVFPRIFRLASVLIVTTLLAGAALNLAMSGWAIDWERLTGTRWGRSILIGGLLGLTLGLFHFVAESRLEPMVRAAGRGVGVETIVRRLQIIPRIGLFILLAVFAFMVGARG